MRKEAETDLFLGLSFAWVCGGSGAALSSVPSGTLPPIPSLDDPRRADNPILPEEIEALVRMYGLEAMKDEDLPDGERLRASFLACSASLVSLCLCLCPIPSRRSVIIVIIAMRGRL